LRRRLPQPIGLWVGGGGAEQLASRRLAPGIVLLTGFRDFEQRAALLARAHAP
jgi:hypothetical protein